jgi:hypothetical protein
MIVHVKMYCCVSQFRLVIGFSNYLQVVSTINYYIISALDNVQSLNAHQSLQSICTSLHGFITQEL